MYKVTYSLVIPTYKRPDSLRRTLDSVLKNNQLPEEVLVVDDDSVPESLVEEMTITFNKRGVSFNYYKKDHSQIRRGLSESKNTAVQIASGEVICFLDDDVILEYDYFSQLFAAWSANLKDTSLLGIGGRIINNRRTGFLEKVYRKVFALSGQCSWDVNDLGFQVWDESVTKTERSYYIHGGVSSYKRLLLQDISFATFSGGRTGLEDVEHCLRAKREQLYFLYVPSAALRHYPQQIGRENAFLSGKKEVENRLEIFRLHCEQDLSHQLLFVWANIGWILKKIFRLRFRESGGMLTALLLRTSPAKNVSIST